MDELTVVREHLVVEASPGMFDPAGLHRLAPAGLRSLAVAALRQIDPALAERAHEIDVRVDDD
nr:hypothetical protein [Micromonospora sp. DSM 115978]